VIKTNSPLDKLKDFIFFSGQFFKIRPKSGSIINFKINRAQQYLHDRLEAQLRDTGKIRAIVLKGRQQGCSTYVAARFFHKTITNRGLKTFILTHEAPATKNLFEMVKCYYEYLPDGLCPKPDKDSAKEFAFNALNASYSLGTAGNKGTGRSQTVQLFHGSEVAFWEHAEKHAMGVLNAIGNAPGTEVILESTANGIGNYFHEMWLGAEEGTNGYQAIFLPWYWQDEYTDYTSGFMLSDEEQALLDMFSENGLTAAHLSWRRKMIHSYSRDFEQGLKRFNQEYPITAAVAFRNPIDDTFINAEYVMRARHAQVDSESALVLGVDPALGNNDRCAIVRRRGRHAFGLEVLRNTNTMELAGHLKRIIDAENPTKIFIDGIGVGAGVIDRLHEMGYTHIVEPVISSRTANNKEQYANVRVECWHEMRNWLYGELPVQIPDRDDLHADLCSIGYKRPKSNGQQQLESKIDLKARGMPSCDLADALAYTFYLGQNVGNTSYKPNMIPDRHRTMFI
jgi:hypothetical protein